MERIRGCQVRARTGGTVIWTNRSVPSSIWNARPFVVTLDDWEHAKFEHEGDLDESERAEFGHEMGLAVQLAANLIDLLSNHNEGRYPDAKTWRRFLLAALMQSPRRSRRTTKT